MFQDEDLVQLLPAGHCVGSIRTRRPLMYVFSGGNEDAAFFSVNGFSILLDGGDQKIVPYWNLIRNYDKISAAVVTRVSPKCLQGISAILMRKSLQECHPHFGSLICNLPPSSITNSDSEASKILRAMHDGLRVAGLKPIEAFANTKMEAVTLYEVIGEGALRMIVLNPERGSKDLTLLVNALKTDENIEKFAVSTSLAFLLIWHPSDHTLPVSRILVTGSCPLEKLYASLEKLKNEEYLRYPEFTYAMKEKPSTARSWKIIQKPTHTKNLSNSSSSRSAMQTTSAASNGSQKKVFRQSLAPSRLMGAKRSVAEPVKTSAVGSSKSHIPENKVGVKPGKSKPTDAKKSATIEITSKERNIGRMKPVDKIELKSPTVKVKNQSSDPFETDVQPAEVQQNPAVSIDVPSLNNVQDAVDLSHPDSSSEAKSFFEAENNTPISPEIPQSFESLVDPQVTDNNGLLDGIEEPMQMRRISMDFSSEAKNFVGDLMEEDTLLLDSTPITLSAPPFQAADLVHDSSGASASKERNAFHDRSIDETAIHNQKVVHKENSQDLFGNVTPFMAGLITNIVDDSSTLQNLLPVNNDEFELSKSSAAPLSLNKLSDEIIECGPNDKLEESERTSQISFGIKRETFSTRNNGSSDSVTAQRDPALDEVIDSLAEASEMVDNARKTFSELEHNVQGVTSQIISNAESVAKADSLGPVEQLTDAVDVFDKRVNNIIHDINDNASALADQNAYEEKRAEEMYLPPMTSAARTRAKPVVNGAKTKPKLSQPLYFDIVFVPHHGPHPTLKDVEAVKAFVTSVRSRRYVLSGKDSIRTYFIDGLISGKEAWNKPELEVDVLPTHDTDEMTLYSYEKVNEIAEAGISLRCSVERCTVRLSSGGTGDTCAAFKFEL